MTRTTKGSAPSEVALRFGANLRRCRQSARMGQEKLARLSGLHRTEISLLERGGREPRIGTLLKLAGPLEVSPNDLLHGLAWQVHHRNPDDGAFYVEDLRVE